MHEPAEGLSLALREMRQDWRPGGGGDAPNSIDILNASRPDRGSS
jgi:hypothetical protein